MSGPILKDQLIIDTFLLFVQVGKYNCLFRLLMHTNKRSNVLLASLKFENLSSSSLLIIEEGSAGTGKESFIEAVRG